MTVRDSIQQALCGVLVKRGVTANPVVNFPSDIAHGDYMTNAALIYGKEAGISPQVLAQELSEGLAGCPGVARSEVAGPGFVNIWLSQEYNAGAINKIVQTPDTWGSGGTLTGKRVMVEYTDPNPFKVFHIGHLMSNAIGESLARLIENNGAQVVRANYQGDTGVHVACAIWGIQKLGIQASTVADFGKAYATGAQAYKEDELIKKEIDAINTKLFERSDKVLNNLYDEGRQKSLDAFEVLYRTLGTRFDHYYFESVTGPRGKEIVLAHPEVFPESEGARVFRGEEHGLHTRVFLNAKGLPTYEAKELGLEQMKIEDYPDVSALLIVTANEVTDYFKVLKKAMECIYPDIARKLTHVAHGMMRLESGKMSSRTGNIVTGDGLLSDLIVSAHVRAKDTRADDLEKLAEQVAVGAIKYQVLRQEIGKDMIFNEERALTLDGDSGPYVQYAHARASAIIERSVQEGVVPLRMANTDTRLVERLLLRFPGSAERGAREYAPHLVAHSIIEVASAFNAWYAQERIFDGEKEVIADRLATVCAVRATLKNGLKLLGISAPEKM
ncbi:MAG: arginine--tRNA ligase [Patescibacteria group bacterium]